jgi:hypothetical protein
MDRISLISDQVEDMSITLGSPSPEEKNREFLPGEAIRPERDSTAEVASSSPQIWQDYCDARLRQFETWR